MLPYDVWKMRLARCGELGWSTLLHMYSCIRHLVTFVSTNISVDLRRRHHRLEVAQIG